MTRWLDLVKTFAMCDTPSIVKWACPPVADRVSIRSIGPTIMGHALDRH